MQPAPPSREILECVVNVSEGTDAAVISQICSAAAGALADVHSDPFHNRSVLTLAGGYAYEAAQRLTRICVDLLDVSAHRGAHPRLGVVDVVPFVPLSLHARGRVANADLAGALIARDRFASWAAQELELPCFLYGPERSLPEIRRRAFSSLEPDTGPKSPHPSAGATSVGARRILVAYNLWLAAGDLDLARAIARDLRGPLVRALGLRVGSTLQVSCNLLEPALIGPEQVFDAVARRADIERAELVGLLPAQVLDPIGVHRHRELDVGEDRTIESRLAELAAPPSTLG